MWPPSLLPRLKIIRTILIVALDEITTWAKRKPTQAFGVSLVLLALIFLVIKVVVWSVPTSVFNRLDLYKPWSERIRDKGILPVGTIRWYYPFSYARGNSAPMGFSAEFTRLLADKIAKRWDINHLQLQEIYMQLPEVEGALYPAIANRQVAMECNATLNLSDHPQGMMLSAPFFVSSVHVLSSVDHPLRTINDIRDKLLISHEGAFMRWADNRLNRELGLSIGLLPAPIIQSTAIMLDEKKAIGAVGDALRLFNVLYAVPDANIWVAGVDSLGEVSYACSMLAGEIELKKVVDESIAEILQSEDYQRLYYRWFLAPQPDWDMNLHYPMPKGLVNLIESHGGKVDAFLAGFAGDSRPPQMSPLLPEMPKAPHATDKVKTKTAPNKGRKEQQ